VLAGLQHRYLTEPIVISFLVHCSELLSTRYIFTIDCRLARLTAIVAQMFLMMILAHYFIAIEIKSISNTKPESYTQYILSKTLC